MVHRGAIDIKSESRHRGSNFENFDLRAFLWTTLRRRNEYLLAFRESIIKCRMRNHIVKISGILFTEIHHVDQLDKLKMAVRVNSITWWSFHDLVLDFFNSWQPETNLITSSCHHHSFWVESNCANRTRVISRKFCQLRK